MIEYKLQNVLMLFWGQEFFRFLEREKIDSILKYQYKLHSELFADLIEFKHLLTLLQKRIGKDILEEYDYLIELDKLNSFLWENCRPDVLSFDDYYIIQIKEIEKELHKLPSNSEEYRDLIS